MSSKWTWAWVLGCASLAGLAAPMAAADSEAADANPYSVISDRNVFHLNPPPPPPEAEAPKPVDLPKVKLTGFIKHTSAGHDTVEVLLAIPPKDNKDSTVYLTLEPGQRDHNVELVQVRYDKEEVDIINSGTPQTLSVKNDSYTPSAAAAPARGGGAPGFPGLGHRPGFPMRTMPAMPRPSADAAPRGSSAIIAGGGGSAIVAGGSADGGNASSPFGAYGGSSGGAIVSGGSPFVPTGAAMPGNNVGDQIANSLFNQQNGRYQVPIPTAPPAPPLVQATGMLAQKLLLQGGPPLPPPLQSMLDDGPPAVP